MAEMIASGAQPAMGTWGPALLTVGSSLFQFFGAQMNANNAKTAANNARVMGAQRAAAAEFEAAQLVQAGGQAIAASQRDAWDVDRAARYAQSRLQALAAASGGGAQSSTVLALSGRLAGEAAYRRAAALYSGTEKDRVLRMQAAAKRYEGATYLQAGELAGDAYDSQSRAESIKAGVAIYKGASTLFEKYGGGGPGNSSSGNYGYAPDALPQE